MPDAEHNPVDVTPKRSVKTRCPCADCDAVGGRLCTDLVKRRHMEREVVRRVREARERELARQTGATKPVGTPDIHTIGEVCADREVRIQDVTGDVAVGT